MLHQQFKSTKEVLIKVVEAVEANAHCHNCKHEDEYNRHDFTSCNFEMSNFLTIADFTEKFTRINVFLLCSPWRENFGGRKIAQSRNCGYF